MEVPLDVLGLSQRHGVEGRRERLLIPVREAGADVVEPDGEVAHCPWAPVSSACGCCWARRAAFWC
jgi:hypothetical protein